MEEFDKYLKGKMEEEERRLFEQKMAGDSALQAELELREGLRQVHFQGKVNQVAKLRQQWQRRRFWRMLGFSGLLLGAAISLLIFMLNQNKKATSSEDVSTELPQNNSLDPSTQKANKTEQKQPELQKQTPKQKYTGPIADGGVVDHFDVEPGSTMRGVYEGLDSLTLQVLDTLIIHTEQLPPSTRNKNWDRAMQQLVRGKPQAAKSSIFEFEKTDAQEAKWLLTLALLGEGRTEEAIEILRTITQKPEFPRVQAARNALLKLEH